MTCRSSLLAGLLLLTAAHVDAQSMVARDDVDYQLRLLLHKQHEIGTRGWGIAGWWVLPDVTARPDRFRSLVLAGPLYRTPQRWLELMGGTLFRNDRDAETLVNLRFAERGIPGLIAIGDIEYYFNARRLYWLLGAERRLLARRGAVLRGGVESENITFPDRRRDLYGIGPRITLALPAGLAVTGAYQFRNDRDFVRAYVLLNL